MDLQQILLMLFSGIAAVGWWAIRHVLGRIDKVESEAQERRVHLAERYIDKAELKELFAKLDIKLDHMASEIYKRINEKADKP